MNLVDLIGDKHVWHIIDIVLGCIAGVYGVCGLLIGLLAFNDESPIRVRDKMIKTSAIFLVICIVSLLLLMHIEPSK